MSAKDNLIIVYTEKWNYDIIILFEVFITFQVYCN